MIPPICSSDLVPFPTCIISITRCKPYQSRSKSVTSFLPSNGEKKSMVILHFTSGKAKTEFIKGLGQKIPLAKFQICEQQLYKQYINLNMTKLITFTIFISLNPIISPIQCNPLVANRLRFKRIRD